MCVYVYFCVHTSTLYTICVYMYDIHTSLPIGCNMYGGWQWQVLFQSLPPLPFPSSPPPLPSPPKANIPPSTSIERYLMEDLISNICLTYSASRKDTVVTLVQQMDRVQQFSLPHITVEVCVCVCVCVGVMCVCVCVMCGWVGGWVFHCSFV